MDKKQHIKYEIINSKDVKLIYTDNRKTFFKNYPACKNCLVKSMCLIIDVTHSDVFGFDFSTAAKIIIKKPCEKFKVSLKEIYG